MICKSSRPVFGNGFTCLQYILFVVIVFALSCKDTSNKTNSSSLKAAYRKIDSNYTKNGYYTKADINFLDSVYSAVRSIDNFSKARRYNFKMHYFVKSNVDSSLIYADSSINLLQNQKLDDESAMLLQANYFVKGDLCFRFKNYDEAIRNYTLGKLYVSADIKNPCKLFGYYHSMANVLYAQQKYLLAAQFFRLKYTETAPCVSANDSMSVFQEIQENMDNTGMCYFKAGLIDSAIYYYDTTLKYIDENEKRFKNPPPGNFDFLRAVVYFNQAEIFHQQKKMDEAEKLYLASVKGIWAYTDLNFSRPLLLSLAGLYLETNQFEKAAKTLKDLSGTIDSVETSSIAAAYYKLQSDYFIKTNQPLAANTYLLKAYNTRDSIEKRDRRFNATDVSKEFENREQKAINQSLKKDNEIKNSYLMVAITSAGMAVIIAFLIWYNLNRKSNYVKKLTVLNTEISMRNEDLQHTLQSLEQSHKENNRIVRVVAHDLKNPISAIRTLVYSLLKKEQNAANKEAFELIQSTCIESISLINDLLNNKRTLSDISTELVDMGRLIEQCTELFQIKAEEKKQQFKLQIDHPIIMMNRQKMWRVISNIVNNAIKFSPENAEISIRLERKTNHVLLSVHDNGIGIPADLKEKIFTIDPEKSREGTAGEKSYGLGLSISRKIIEEHAGKLWFESEPGKGSVFYVELPYGTDSEN